MQPDNIETKRLRLVGVEMYINLQENFTHKLNAMEAEIKARLHEIQNKKNENIGIGMWQAPVLDDPNSNIHGQYFLGVEVNEYNDIPYGMVCKDLPESKFAVFNESEHGTVTQSKDGGYSWLKSSNYQFNTKIIADFETYNFDEEIKNHEVWIPIIEKLFKK
jgi:predicted transcriptional regulator YdeE